MVKHKLGAQTATAAFLLFLASSAPGQCDESKPGNGSSTSLSKNAGFTNTTGSTSTIDRTSTFGSTTTFDRTTTNGSTTTTGFTTATGATRTTGATSTTGATATTGVTGSTTTTGLRDSSARSALKPVVKDWGVASTNHANAKDSRTGFTDLADAKDSSSGFAPPANTKDSSAVTPPANAKDSSSAVAPPADAKDTSATKETIAPSTEVKPSGASALPDHITPSWETKSVEEKPKDKPAPPGQDAAVKLYSARKFAPAATMFEKFIKDGTANPETHAYLAYCYYSLKHYTKALQQFNWVEKNTPNNYKLRTSAERSGSMLRTQMSGICPQPCLKPNDSRWRSGEGGHRWISWRTSTGTVSISDGHVGQLVTVKNDQIVNQGVCPTCGGTGRVPPLRDGDPLPR